LLARIDWDWQSFSFSVWPALHDGFMTLFLVIFD